MRKRVARHRFGCGEDDRLDAASSPEAQDGPVYFVPAGRIGIRAPAELQPDPNRWSLLSSDHTMTVRVHEALSFGVKHDAHLWDKDDRSARVASAPIAGFEVRRFKDLRYGESADYADDTIVLRDDWRIGEVEASNGNHGGVSPYPGGQELVLSLYRPDDALAAWGAGYPSSASAVYHRSGCSPTYRANQGRPELQAACCLRWPWSTADHAA